MKGPQPFEMQTGLGRGTRGWEPPSRQILFGTAQRVPERKSASAEILLL